MPLKQATSGSKFECPFCHTVGYISDGPCCRGERETRARPDVRIGQRWRTEDGYICDVVGFSLRAHARWPWVRHPNATAPGSGHAVNPAWFERWTLLRDSDGNNSDGS